MAASLQANLVSDMKLKLLQFSFSFTLLCGTTFFLQVNVVSENMQCKTKDIVATTQLMKACSDCIDNYRDVGYCNWQLRTVFPRAWVLTVR